MCLCFYFHRSFSGRVEALSKHNCLLCPDHRRSYVSIARWPCSCLLCRRARFVSDKVRVIGNQENGENEVSARGMTVGVFSGQVVERRSSAARRRLVLPRCSVQANRGKLNPVIDRLPASSARDCPVITRPVVARSDANHWCFREDNTCSHSETA